VDEKHKVGQASPLLQKWSSECDEETTRETNFESAAIFNYSNASESEIKAIASEKRPDRRPS